MAAVCYAHVRSCSRNAVVIVLNLEACHTVHDPDPTLDAAEPSVVSKTDCLTPLSPFQSGVGGVGPGQADLVVSPKPLKVWIRSNAVVM